MPKPELKVGSRDIVFLESFGDWCRGEHDLHDLPWHKGPVIGRGIHWASVPIIT